MQFDPTILILGGTAALSMASAAAAGVQCFGLKKRVRVLEAQAGGADGELLEDQQALASRVSSMQSSIVVLQSGIAELQESMANLGSRPEPARHDVDKIFGDSSRGSNKGRRTKFQTEMGPVAPINLNQRGQMMRMHRRGDSVSAIASALGISQGEVKLTVRMQELHSDFSETEKSQDRL